MRDERSERARDEQVLGVQHATDVVDRLVVDGQPRVAGLLDDAHGVLDRRGVRQRRHVGARHHDLARDLLGEVGDRLEQRLLGLLALGLLVGLDDRYSAPVAHADAARSPLATCTSHAHGAPSTRATG